MKSKFIALAAICALSISQVACSSADFIKELNLIGPAVGIILQIVAVAKGVPADASIPAKIDKDVAGLEKLYSDELAAVDSASKQGIDAQINAGFSVLNSDLSTIFSVAQVSNPNTQLKITSLIGLVESAVQLAEVAIPGGGPTSARAQSEAPSESAKQLQDSFNQILKAKIGVPNIDAATAKMHLGHANEFVHVMTFGVK